MVSKSAERSPEIFFAAHLIESHLTRVPSMRQLADAWGTKHSNLSRIINDLTSFGPDMEKLFARRFADGKRDAFSDMAAAWREKNPDWYPEGYLAKHGDHRPNRSFPWWEKEASALLSEQPELDWAIYHAGERVRGPEPKQDRRSDYVRREVETIAESSDSEKKRLFREFRDMKPKPRPSGKISLRRSGGRSMA